MHSLCLGTKDVKKDKTFKIPKHVGKLNNLNSALEKVDRGFLEEQLAAKEYTWIFLTIQVYKQPVILKSTGHVCRRWVQFGRR